MVQVVADYVLISVAAVADLKVMGLAMWSDLPKDILIPEYLSVQVGNVFRAADICSPEFRHARRQSMLC
jgi:hypothetical protein